MDGQRENTVSAPGVGRAGVVPDAAQLDLSVEVTEESPAVAYAGVNAALSRVVAVLDEHRVAPAQRQTRRLSLRPHYEATPGTMTATLVGYQATVGLRVQLVELTEVPRVLEAVVAAGGEALTVGGFALVNRELGAARAHAESAAVVDATARAQRLAEAAGATLGAVVSIHHDPPQAAGLELQSLGLGRRAESAGVAVEAGEDDVVAQVTVVFALGA